MGRQEDLTMNVLVYYESCKYGAGWTIVHDGFLSLMLKVSACEDVARRIYY